MQVLCETTELAVECLHLARAIELSVEPEVPTSEWTEAAKAAKTAHHDRTPLGIALKGCPSLESLVAVAEAQVARGRRVVIACTGLAGEELTRLGAGADLGLAMVTEIEPLLAALSLLQSGAERPWAASTRRLNAVDRGRLRAHTSKGEPNDGELLPGNAIGIAYRATGSTEVQTLGRARDVGAALSALRACDDVGGWVRTEVDGIERQQVLDILFGPKRGLSDPSSKAALAPYGLPMPNEELCSSPSRAAAEAARLGFPVRIALASPDLRIWDHPELVLDMVDSAAAVRNTFRQLMAVAKHRTDASHGAREPRLLGVTVTAANAERAVLSVHCRPLQSGRVAARVAFADEHGRAANDALETVLPMVEDRFERVLRRLAGHDLLFGDQPALRKEAVANLANVLLRTAAFVSDFRDQVTSVALRPAALLLDGSVEVREACVSVSEVFEHGMTHAG